MKKYLKYLITEELYLVREDKYLDNIDLERPAVADHAQVEKLVNKTIVLIDSNGSNPYREQDRELLEKILLAVKEDPQQILLFDFAESGPHQDLPGSYHLTNCRILGFLDTLTNQAREIFAGQRYMIRSSGGYESMLADPLVLIDKDLMKKKKLWAMLKNLFGFKA